MKKRIFTDIGIIVVIIIILIAIFVVKDLRQEKTLREEIASIQKLTDPEQMDMDAVNEKL